MVDDHLQATQLHEFFTARSGAALAGANPQTLREKVAPDALMISESGEKAYPLFTRETLLAYAARRKGGAR